ncbi:hypothetical protein B566_EDAN016697, partial [Ephemera danica]
MGKMGDSTGLLRVLCLHGYRQSADTFRNKLGALRKMLKKQVEFVFVTAPHAVPVAEGQEDDTQQFGWWFCTEDRTFNARTPCKTSVGLEESWAMLSRVFEEQGPFHGVLGFSQGAALAAMLAAKAQADPVFQFEFIILVAGFKSLCEAHAEFYTPPQLPVPSLHVYGSTDQVIHPDLSRSLAEGFASPEVLEHPGGHFVPATS